MAAVPHLAAIAFALDLLLKVEKAKPHSNEGSAEGHAQQAPKGLAWGLANDAVPGWWHGWHDWRTSCQHSAGVL